VVFHIQVSEDPKKAREQRTASEVTHNLSDHAMHAAGNPRTLCFAVSVRVDFVMRHFSPAR
jgi:hypothetical protein